jgi:predicted RNase H-like HicB family nuclease
LLYTVVIQQEEGWWIGWIEGIPSVNSQGETCAELMENLLSALSEGIEMQLSGAPATRKDHHAL